MKSALFTYKNSSISYLRFGSGPEVLVAFHGYNQSASLYAYFEEALAHRFTVIAIDFFWHGQSIWNEAEDFTESDMKAVVAGIKQQEGLSNTRFSVCSFSMGARLARALIRSFPERINDVVFISPPTFSFNRFLNFTTNHPVGLFAFRYFLNNPGTLERWVKNLHRIKLLNRAVFVFTSKFVGQSRLEKVFKTWYAQRKLKTDFAAFAQLLNTHHIRVTLIAGKNDHITPPHRMIRYVRKLKHHQVFLVDQKHELTTPQTFQLLKEIWGDKSTKKAGNNTDF